MPRSLLLLPSGALGILPGGALAVSDDAGACSPCCGGGGGGGPCECSVDSGAGFVGIGPNSEGSPWGLTFGGAGYGGAGLFVRITRQLLATWQGVTLINSSVTRTYHLSVDERQVCEVSWFTDTGYGPGPIQSSGFPDYPGVTADASLGSDFNLGGIRQRAVGVIARDDTGPVRSLSNELRSTVVGTVPTSGSGRGGVAQAVIGINWPSVVFTVGGTNTEYTPVTASAVALQANLISAQRSDRLNTAGYTRLLGTPAPAGQPPIRQYSAVNLTHQGSGSVQARTAGVTLTCDYSARCVADWYGPIGQQGVPTTFGHYDGSVRIEVGADFGLRPCEANRPGPPTLEQAAAELLARMNA